MTDEEIRKKAIKLINQEDEKLLFDLIQYNRKHGTKSDEEIVAMWNKGYESLNKDRNSKGKIDIEHALQVLQDDINYYDKKIANIDARLAELRAQK